MVSETDSHASGTRSRTLLTSVPLPAPDGPDKTNKLPLALHATDLLQIELREALEQSCFLALAKTLRRRLSAILSSPMIFSALALP